ncbi:MAG: hypothetical protein Q8R97_11920 [Brevundimonas sp.]|jgi:hypothetical protein|uniref:hypothetical protein n=1 Tax=Brevundimonas sp. TaxID=1871086 RepID=UPI002779470E|nr:hypothetical protein [Brevundimonas sp.]MDP3401818.1 hypothetical protein [Brevundimonas sp.]MDZ4113886.1 hypothetical protein [Brevundimonas sp.]
MPLIPTLISLAVVVGFGVFSGWRGARPPDLIRGPRLVPWRFLMIAAAAIALALLVHLVSLIGGSPGT